MQSSTPTESPRGSRLRALLLQPRAFLVLLVLALFLTRARVLSTRITGVRPTQTAMISDNLGRDLGEIGPRALFYPRIDYAGDQPGYLLLEFPLVNLAGVVLAKAVGLARETAYRLPSLLFLAAMLPFFFAFVRTRFGTPEAVLSALLVLSFPVVVDQSVEPMPEQGAATAFVAGLYFFERHVRQGRSRPLLAAAACFAAMLLIKSTFALLLLVPAVLSLCTRGQTGSQRRAQLLAGAACFVPLAAWMAHAAPVNRSSVLDDGTLVSELVSNFVAQHGRWKLLTSVKTYGEFWAMLSHAYGSSILVLFSVGSVSGLFLCRGNRALLAAWIASFLLFFVAVPWNASNHWYYTHGYATLIALVVAVLLRTTARSCAGLVPRRVRRPAGLILVALAFAFVVQTNFRTTPQVDPKMQEFGRTLQDVTSPRSLGIISSEEKGIWDGELFYVSDTRGWRTSTRRGLSRRPISEEFIADKRRLGAEFLAHYGPPDDLAAKIPDLFRRLTEEDAVLASGPDWIVFSLKP